MDDFGMLRLAMALKAKGLNNAAKAKWLELSDDFRLRVLKTSVLCTQTTDEEIVESPKKIISPYGEFIFSKDRIRDPLNISVKDFREVIPTLAQ